jgi:hypothetical protein
LKEKRYRKKGASEFLIENVDVNIKGKSKKVFKFKNEFILFKFDGVWVENKRCKTKIRTIFERIHIFCFYWKIQNLATQDF